MKKKVLTGCLIVAGLAFVCCCIGPALLFRTDSTPPALSANPNRTDGTALYLLIDVSGSMSSGVPDAGGTKTGKILIARRAAVEVCNAVAKHAADRKDYPIQLAVASFSSDASNIVPMGAPDAQTAALAINALHTGGDTAIGDAAVMAQQALDATRLRSQHILIITDGQNTSGRTPEAVAKAINTIPQELRPTVYIIAFDIAASTFDAVKAEGWQIFPAADGKELSQRLDEVVGGKILIER